MRFMIYLLIFVAILVGVIQWRANAREAQAEADHPPVGDFVEVDGIRVHYKIEGSGPDLILLHGASGNLNDFTLAFTDRLTDRYRVILFDRPGLGWTERPRGFGGAWNSAGEAPTIQAALLQAAADQIGVTNPIVLGHSFGGIVSLAWALARPDDTAALVLVGAVAEPWPGDLGWTYATFGTQPGGALLVPAVTAFLPQSYISSSLGAIFEPQAAPIGYLEHLGVGLTLRRESSRANYQQVQNVRPHIVAMKPHYSSLTLPIEAVHGDADTIVPLEVHARVLMQDVPNGALTVLPGQGHMPQHTAPQAVVDAIDRAATRAGLR